MGMVGGLDLHRRQIVDAATKPAAITNRSPRQATHPTPIRRANLIPRQRKCALT
jgi:hypothetical protein